MLDSPTTQGGLAALAPLAVELCDLKRVRDASSSDSLASRMFRRGWAALLAGQDPADVALRTTADALAAARLGGIDRDVLAIAGVTGAEATSILERSTRSPARLTLPCATACACDWASPTTPGQPRYSPRR